MHIHREFSPIRNSYRIQSYRIEISSVERNNFYDARFSKFTNLSSLTLALEAESIALKDRVCHSRSGYQWGCLFCIAKDCSFYCSPFSIIPFLHRGAKGNKYSIIEGNTYTYPLLTCSPPALSLSERRKKRKKRKEKERERFEINFSPTSVLVFSSCNHKRNHETARIVFSARPITLWNNFDF